MTTRPHLAMDVLSTYREKAVKHRDIFAAREEAELRSALRQLQPPCAPVTIQLFQAIDQGRLVDVGPRPPGMETAGTIFQLVDEGRTGALFQDAMASNRFTPTRQPVPPGPGTFSLEQLVLEKERHGSRTGTWSKGIPKNIQIAQLPLTALPVTLCPKRGVNGDEVLRLPHLGAVYTLLSSGKADFRDDPYFQTLILYALCAGQIAHDVRFEMILGAHDKQDGKAPWVDRFAMAKHLWQLRDSGYLVPNWHRNRAELVDSCAVVGTLMLNHHLFFPFDPLVHKLFCALSSPPGTAHEIYYIHRCCPPVVSSEEASTCESTVDEMVTRLVEDIDLILTLYYRDRDRAKTVVPGAREHYLRLLRGSVLTMLVQLCGDLHSGHSYENKAGDELQNIKSDGRYMWSWIGPSSTLAKHLGTEIESHSLVYTATGFDKACCRSDDFSDWMLSLLAAGNTKRESGRIHKDSDGNFVVARSGKAHQLAEDDHKQAAHFLRAHTRATWNVLKGCS